MRDAAVDRRKALYIPTLAGWRAISIAFVIVSHVLVQSPLMVSLAPLGVSIFFSISGYLICTLLLQERARTGAVSAGILYPAYFPDTSASDDLSSRHAGGGRSRSA